MPPRSSAARCLAVLLGLAAAHAALAQSPTPDAPIDREALVRRHDPVLRQFDAESPLSLGNGDFAFTADVTGLQTFPAGFEKTIPLTTMSEWGWHTAPNPRRYSIDRFAYSLFKSYGREVGYADIPGEKRTPEIEWLRTNPHRMHLGRLGLRLTKASGLPVRPADLKEVEQRLDLWNGILESRFKLDGESVEVLTVVHPLRDALAVRLRSPLLLRAERLSIELRFPYGSADTTAADWNRPNAHLTVLRRSLSNEGDFERRLDADVYHVSTRFTHGGGLEQRWPHGFEFTGAKGDDSFELVLAFGPQPQAPPPSFAETRSAASEHWNRFWREGGAIDLSQSRDPRWRELERRIVLSQYLTRIQCASRTPPQESGLTFNSWYGKFHLEMHWWHAAHFALWNRLPLLERSLGYYSRILDRARATAERQGYSGARWPKMTDPSGAESPSLVGPFLVWQQPHPIFYAELVRRERDERATLERHRDVVFATADFMASFPAWDAASRRYVLGPPLQCAQELYPKERTLNCGFELAYWRWGLETAQRWREALGLARDEGWERVLQGLAPLSVRDGKYRFAETVPDPFSNPRWRRDHPSIVGALGILPGPGVEPETMRRTLRWIFENWDFPSTWGWDYPMLAMSAARLGEPGRAVDALLLNTEKNVFRANGHNHQRPGLTVYLPGNGGLLYAVALMAAGWDGAPDRPAPGFPDDGSWTVRAEGLRRAP